MVVGAAAAVLVSIGVPALARPRAPGQDDAAALARLVARPLVPEGFKEPTLSDAELIAGLDSRTAQADALAATSGDLAPIAHEFADAFRAMKEIVNHPPSVQPLIRSGIETWQKSLEKDDRGTLIGLLGIGSELSKLSEETDKASAVHTRIVACRLRLAEIVRRAARPEATSDTVSYTFVESRPFSQIESDTLYLTNVSGVRLTDVFVAVELTGASGETFSNGYFADAWEAGETRLAVCRSERPGRETVHDVKKVRFQVFAAERTSRQGELTR
jgi:hypothetical protein